MLRPDEAALLQPLGIERHAEAVMPKDLDQVTSGAPENVEIAGMGIAPECFLDLKRQRVHPLAHVGPPARQPHPHTRRDRDHRRSRRSSTRRSALPSTPLPTRTRYPASSISIVSA